MEDRFTFAKHKILFVGARNDEVNRAHAAFTKAGVPDFRHAVTGAEARFILSDFKAGVIFIEAELPAMPGIELIHKIRRDEGPNRNSPIILLIRKVSVPLLQEACRAGVEGVLREPVEPETLIKIARAVILQPRRFVYDHHYFGPERRKKRDGDYDGPDRRMKRDIPISGVTNLPGAGVYDKSADTADTWAETVGGDAAPTPTPAVGGYKPTGGKLDMGSPPDKPVKEPPTPIEVAADTAAPVTKSAPIEVAPAPQPKPKPQPKLQPQPEIEPAPEPEPGAPPTLDQVLERHRLWLDSNGGKGEKGNFEGAALAGAELAAQDFTGIALRRADLRKANCERAVFRKADLSEARFDKAAVQDAEFNVARLRRACFAGARLEGACFLGADLVGAVFTGAQLSRVDFSSSNIRGADFRGVNLLNTKGIRPEQLRDAKVDAQTILPRGMARDQG